MARELLQVRASDGVTIDYQSSSVPLLQLREPVTLACGHNFELALLKAHFQAGAHQCPGCGALVGIEADELRINAEVLHLIMKLRPPPPPPPVPGAQPLQVVAGDLAAGTGSPSRADAAAAAVLAGVAMSTVADVDRSSNLRSSFGTGAAGATSASSLPLVVRVDSGGNKGMSPLASRVRTGLPTSYPFCRDSAQVEAVTATYFARQLTAVIARSHQGEALSELPISLTKRVMKQDAVNMHLRMVSAEAVDLMAYGNELFIGLITELAWHVSTLPGKRVTVDLRDLQVG